MLVPELLAAPIGCSAALFAFAGPGSEDTGLGAASVMLVPELLAAPIGCSAALFAFAGPGSEWRLFLLDIALHCSRTMAGFQPRAINVTQCLAATRAASSSAKYPKRYQVPLWCFLNTPVFGLYPGHEWESRSPLSSSSTATVASASNLQISLAACSAIVWLPDLQSSRKNTSTAR
jgi:hypothetical protein